MNPRYSHMNKSLVVLSTLFIVLSIAGCKKEEESNKQETKNRSIHRDEDIGYYSGYYVSAGQELVVLEIVIIIIFLIVIFA